MMQHSGACHCGAVRITIPRKPDYVNNCNCTLCTKHAGLWGYYDPAEVSVSGDTRTYIRADMAEPAIGTHFCGECGCTTHSTMVDAFVVRHSPKNGNQLIRIKLLAIGIEAQI
jgi:hypothetical protein